MVLLGDVTAVQNSRTLVITLIGYVFHTILSALHVNHTLSLFDLLAFFIAAVSPVHRHMTSSSSSSSSSYAGGKMFKLLVWR